MVRAVKKANHYVEAGIKFSKDLGRGSGPINHFHSTYTLPFAPYVGASQSLPKLDVRLGADSLSTCLIGMMYEGLGGITPNMNLCSASPMELCHFRFLGTI